ncbi:hypothetical protein ACFY0G_38985 [Streptomyces sp. NPDC001552]|uniref:hypothetical protein n=1 Tax=Streptomyces sp. NPDC001552 TaxID=3364587 RepID=UPI003683C870
MPSVQTGELRDFTDHPQRLLHEGVIGVGEHGAQVRGLHRAGPAARGDEEVIPRQVPREVGYEEVRRLVALQAVASHHSDEGWRRTEILRERARDTGIVRGLLQTDLGRERRGATVLDEPGVDGEVVRLRETHFVVGQETLE